MKKVYRHPNFAHFWFVFLQGFNGRFGIFLLPDTHDGIGDKDQKDNKGLNKCSNSYFVLYTDTHTV